MVMVFAGITYLTAVGISLFAVIDILERLTIPWHVSHRALLEPTRQGLGGRRDQAIASTNDFESDTEPRVSDRS